MKKLFLFLFALVVSIGTARADNKTAYFYPNMWETEGTEYFAAYVWHDDVNEWIDLETTVTIDGKTCYKIEVDDAYTGIIFTRAGSAAEAKNWNSNRWNQSVDLTLSDNTLYSITAWDSDSYWNQEAGKKKSSASSSAVASYSATFATGLDWENVYAYAWTGDGDGATKYLGVWPGTKMTATSEKFTIDNVAQTIYTVSILSTAAAPAKILFNKGEQGPIGVDQTADLTFTDGKFYFLPTTIPTEPTANKKKVVVVYSNYYDLGLGTYGTDYASGWGAGIASWSAIEEPFITSERKVLHVTGSGFAHRLTKSSGRNNAVTLDGNKTYTQVHVSVFPKTATTLYLFKDNGWDAADKLSVAVTPGKWNVMTLDVPSTWDKNFYGIALKNGEENETDFYLDDFYFTNEGAYVEEVLSSVVMPHTFWSAIQGAGPFAVNVLDAYGNDYFGDIELSWVDNKAPVGAKIEGKEITFGAASGEGAYILKATSGEISVTTPVYMVGNNDILTPPANAVMIYGNGTDNDWQYYNGGAIQDNVFTLGTTPVKSFLDTRCVFVANKDLNAWNADVNPTEKGYTSIHFSIYSPIEGQKVNISFEQTITIGNNHLQTLSKGWNDCSVDLTGETKIHTISLRNENAKADEEGPSIAVANIYYTRDMPEGYYIIGSMTDNWTVKREYQMTLNTSAEGEEYKFGPITLNQGDEFKVIYSQDGTSIYNNQWYPGGSDPNYTVAANGKYDIYFRPNHDGGGDWFYGYIYLAVSGLVDTGTDPNTGAHVLTGKWNADDFAALDATAKANSYDLTALTTSPEGVITTNQKNVLFICRADQNIAKNKVVDNGSGYTGTNIEILDYNEYNGRGTGMNTKISPITGNVALHRVLPRAGIYLTQVVPFDVAVPADANAYEATTTTNKSGEITITFTEVTQMKAGVPYLMHATNGGVHFTANSINFSIANKEMTDAAFKATYSIIDPVPANTYVMPKGDKAVKAEFLTAAANSYIPAFRGYIELPAQTDARINVVFNDATGIHAATTEQLEGIFNIYSIDGKLVRQNTESKVGLEKGIYIINGKKVVIK